MLNRKALGAICGSLSENVFFNIVKKTTMSSLIDALEKIYEKPSTANKILMMIKLFGLKGRGMTAVEYINQFNSILAQLLSVKITFDDEVHVLLILSGLSNDWNNLVVTLRNSYGNENLCFINVAGFILGQESWRQIADEDDNSGVVLCMEDDRRDNKRKEQTTFKVSQSP